MGPSWVMEPSSAPNPGPATNCWYLEAQTSAPAGFGCFRLSQAFVKTQTLQRLLRLVTDLGKGCIQVTFFLEERRNSHVSAAQKHTQL